VSTTARVEVARERPGLNISMGEGPAPVVSDVWTLGGWTIQFVRLGPGQGFELAQAKGTVYVKVVAGRLAEPDRSAYAAPKVVRDTIVVAGHVEAGPQGALFTVFTATPAVASRVTSMSQLRFGGPHADALRWQTFEDRFKAVTPYFDGLDAHLAPGFHLLDADGAEIAHVFVWTAGKGVDLSTHNHGRAPGPTSPAFAEVHWVIHNGTGSGGMYETAEPGAPTRDRYPMQRGEEHGPFFEFDRDTGAPRLRDNGAVAYPWHGWEAGTDDAEGQAYDVVAAFEITAPFARVVA